MDSPATELIRFVGVNYPMKDLCAEVTFRKAFEEFTHPGNNREKLKNVALADKLYPVVGDGMGVPGRSIAWKVFPLSIESCTSHLPYQDFLTVQRTVALCACGHCSVVGYIAAPPKGFYRSVT